MGREFAAGLRAKPEGRRVISCGCIVRVTHVRMRACERMCRRAAHPHRLSIALSPGWVEVSECLRQVLAVFAECKRPNKAGLSGTVKEVGDLWRSKPKRQAWAPPSDGGELHGLQVLRVASRFGLVLEHKVGFKVLNRWRSGIRLKKRQFRRCRIVLATQLVHPVRIWCSSAHGSHATRLQHCPPSFEFLSVLSSAERDMSPHLLDGDCGMCETSTSQGSGWPKIKPRHLFLNSSI